MAGCNGYYDDEHGIIQFYRNNRANSWLMALSGRRGWTFMCIRKEVAIHIATSFDRVASLRLELRTS